MTNPAAVCVGFRHTPGIFLPLILALWVAAAGIASEAASPATPPPERLVLNLTADPATSIAVTWRTNAPVASPVVQVTLAVAEAKLAQSARTISARSESVPVDGPRTVWHHAAVLPDLTPGRLYAYRVGDGMVWSEWNQFRTAEKTPAPFRFLYLGDPQNDIHEYCSRAFRAAYARAPDSAFLLVAGDLVTSTTNDRSWGEIFDAAGWITRVMPSLLTPGNHDYQSVKVDGKSTKSVSALWRPHFTLPENGPAGLGELTYYVDYQGVRLVVLNGNERTEEQAAWLDRLLAVNPNRWTIVLIHQPAYSTGKDRDNPKLRGLLVPIYDKHSVDLVLQGHDHSYGRSFKLRGGRVVGPSEPGTVYVASVCGPKTYPINPLHRALMAKLESGPQLYQVITIDDRQLRFEAWTVTGDRFDGFELSKPAQQSP